MKFTIGQKIVCVNARYNSFCAFPLKKGEIYTVSGFYKCECGSDQLFLQETLRVILMACSCHRTSTRRQSYYNWRFRPLQYYSLYNELFENRSEVGEKSDIPIQIPEKVNLTKSLRNQKSNYASNR